MAQSVHRYLVVLKYFWPLSVCQTDVNSKNILDSNWTNKFAETFSEVNAMCVLIKV